MCLEKRFLGPRKRVFITSTKKTHLSYGNNKSQNYAKEWTNKWAYLCFMGFFLLYGYLCKFIVIEWILYEQYYLSILVEA